MDLRKPHGGARKGAGRKPAEVKKVNLTVSISPEAKARIEAKASAKDVSASAIVDAWARKLKP
jgi:hypothetical protein